MPSTVTAKCSGLYLQPNDLSAVPDGALSVAENVVVSRDDICEIRRGFAVQNAAPKSLARLFPFKGYLLGFGGSVLSRSLDSGATWIDYVGSFAPPSGYAIRGAEQNGNLYLTTGTGVQRLDAIDGTPEAAGAPAGLDAQAVLAGAGTAQAANSQVAYRVLWGKRDANQNVILGAPSGRAVVTNASGGTTQNVTVSTSIPAGVTGEHFWQIYRTPPSVDANTDPGDEEGLIFEATAPGAATATGLSRTANVVTATTATAHGYMVGQVVRVGPGGQTGGSFVSVGYNVAATSPDGTTWTSRSIPAGTWIAVASNGTINVAIGANIVATSPDGITWTSRTIPAGDYRSVVWNGSLFVAVGGFGSISQVCATSPDGITWTARTMPAGSYMAAVWTGSLVVAVGHNGTAATSPDGITWTSRSLPAGSYLALAWSGSVLAAVGYNAVATSPDGATWTARSSAGALAAIVWGASGFVAVGSNNAKTSPDGVTWTARTMPAGSYQALAYTGAAYSATGYNSSCASSADGVTWTTRTVPAGTYNGNVGQASIAFAAGERIIASVPTGTTFTYAETGGNGSIAAPQTVQPLTVAATISTPPAYSGAALYTNPSQSGILYENDAPPLSRDAAAFRGMLVFANTTDPAYLSVSLLAAGGSLGVQSGDTITVNGVTWTAGAAESIPNKTFAISATGIPSVDIRETAASLIRIINRTGSAPIYALDVSDPAGVPGVLRFTARAATDTLTLSVSRSSSWSLTGGTTASPKTQKNLIRWTKKLQPDAAPAIFSQPVASADREVLRIVPTRDSVFIWKDEDGLFRLSGDTPETIRIDPFDYNTHLVAAETAYALDNKVFALSEQGVVAATDTGVQLISRPIETALQPLLAGNMRAVTRSLAFAIGVESDRKYILFLPTLATDTVCTQAFVFDLITQGWTHWTLSAAHGLSLGSDDHVYLVDGSSVRRERKDFAITDYAEEDNPVTVTAATAASVTLLDASYTNAGDVISDGTQWGIVTGIAGNECSLDRAAGIGVGAATVYRAIPAQVEWVPRFAEPGMMHRFSEVSLQFRTAYFAQAALAFATDLAPAPETVNLTSSWQGVQDHPVVRTIVPRNESVGSLLRVRYSQAQAWSPMAIQALGVAYVPGTAPVVFPKQSGNAPGAFDGVPLYE